MFLGLLTFALCADAQLQPPPGWTVVPIQGAVVLNSPSPMNSPSVLLTLLPPAQAFGQEESWFTTQTIVRSQAAGRPLAATSVLHRGPMMIRVVRIQTPGQTFRAVYYSYFAAGGQQLVVLIIPDPVGDNDPRVLMGDGYVQELAAQRIDLGWVLAYASPAPQPGSPNIYGSASPADQLQRNFDQARSLQRFQNNMTTLTIDQMHAMSH
jgi:hypothetical protein